MKINRRLCMALLAGSGFGCAHPINRNRSDSRKITISQESFQWMETAAAKAINGCQRKADHGITLFTPDGVGKYGALWTRDFYYMLQIFDQFNEDDVKLALQYLMDGVSDRGIAPDRRRVDGITVYEAGGMGHPVAKPPLDNAAFLVSLIYLYSNQTNDYDLAIKTLPLLNRAMQAIPRSENGLVWNDPHAPHSPYGFTDTVGKTGELLICSLLDWKASKKMVELSDKTNHSLIKRHYQLQMKTIEKNIFQLFDHKNKLFFAASHDCKQIDVWGNAFMVSTGFPLPIEVHQNIVQFFANRYDEVIEKGQVRHLIKGEYWNRLLIPIEKGTYQNGGYWSTPSGWVMTVFAHDYPHLAENIWNDLVLDFKTRGIHEWVNGDTVRLPHYVASVVNPLASVRMLIKQGLAEVV